VLTGLLAGCTEAFIVVPFDLIKIRLQDKESAGKYRNTFDAVRRVVAEEGMFGFFKGMESTLWRHGIWSAVYFGCIGVISDFIKSSASASPSDGVSSGGNQQQQQLSTNQKFAAGLVGGTLATLCNTPFDVVKTRIQNNVYVGWTLPGCFHVAKREGVRALWKGFVPKVMRLGPGGGIMLVIFERVSDWLRIYA
jgi:solute carrier family 25 (mitochondrial 2-oxodicarboxylate transporter), member 21